MSMSRWIRRASLAALVLATPAVMNGQTKTTPAAKRASPKQPTTSAESRYAQSIERVADSVIVYNKLALVEGIQSAGSLERMYFPLRHVKRMQTLAGDFEVVNPPPGMERMHDQMVRALKGMSDYMTTLVGAIAAACPGTISEDGQCTEGLSSRGMLQVGALMQRTSPIGDYADARERAARMLAERGIQITPTSTK
jgi:hypothetical protein